jgi:catechol 2,3-dioxygenase-like lactoylglutathione lyase family enzyme
MNYRFRHVCLKCRDLERSISFYCEHLGFRRGPAFTDAAGKMTGIFLYLNKGVFFELFQGDPGSFTGHLCFEVGDIRDTVRRLREKGIEVSDPALGRSKALITGLRDPDGNSLELNEFSPPDSWIKCFLAEHDPDEA